MGGTQVRENSGGTAAKSSSGCWRCPSCHDTVPGRLAIGALACDTPQGTMVVGMDRPVHKCSFMPKWAEAEAMQELAKLLQENVDWRDNRDVQRHLAHGPVVGYSDYQGDTGTAPRVWRWIPRPVAYDTGLPEYVLQGATEGVM